MCIICAQNGRMNELVTANPHELLKQLNVKELSPTLVLLVGEVGTGKTTLVQSFLKEIGVQEPVDSPTFSIINIYHDSAGKQVIHTDWYRVKDEDELRAIGVEEYLDSDQWIFVEWPEIGAGLLRGRALLIQIEHREGKRSYKWEYLQLG